MSPIHNWLKGSKIDIKNEKYISEPISKFELQVSYNFNTISLNNDINIDVFITT